MVKVVNDHVFPSCGPCAPQRPASAICRDEPLAVIHLGKRVFADTHPMTWKRYWVSVPKICQILQVAPRVRHSGGSQSRTSPSTRSHMHEDLRRLLVVLQFHAAGKNRGSMSSWILALDVGDRSGSFIAFAAICAARSSPIRHR
jgi:hypothetical protein